MLFYCVFRSHTQCLIPHIYLKGHFEHSNRSTMTSHTLCLTKSHISFQLVPLPEVSLSRIPPDRPPAADLDYYRVLIPSRIAILRGSMHQGNQKLYGHQAGKQGPSNPMAALVMRRLYKSNEWVPKLVDDILTLGEMIYDEFKVSVVDPDQTCKVKDLPKKIEWEEKVYEPDVEELAVNMGML